MRLHLTIRSYMTFKDHISRKLVTQLFAVKGWEGLVAGDNYLALICHKEYSTGESEKGEILILTTRTEVFANVKKIMVFEYPIFAYVHAGCCDSGQEFRPHCFCR